jgi:type II secretion system protein C
VALGAAAFAVVVLYRLGPDLWNRFKQDSVSPPVAISEIPAQSAPSADVPGQIGAIEPAGVAKPLKLFAVTVGQNPAQGLAVLGPAEASSRTYAIGAVLENGAQLSQVQSDHVVLKRDGQTYRLYLPNAGKADEIPRQGAALTVGDFPTPAPALPAPALRTTDYIRVAPVYQGDVITGYRLYPGTRRSLFERAGLQEGDILTALSGQVVLDPDQVSGALDQLASGAVIVAEVRRGEQTLQVRLDGSGLLATSTPSMPSNELPAR